MLEITRRDWLAAASAAVASAMLPTSVLSAELVGFTLPPLPYKFDALEPSIDAKTMEIHHDRHHKAYVDNLNKALAGSEWLSKPIEDVIKNIPKMPEDIQQSVTNNGGGHYNHSMFWQILGREGGKPSDDLLKAWGGSFELMQKAIKDAAMARFGSGWAWLVYDKSADAKLSVISTANQDCPLMYGKFPVLGVDVWEHAYYLKYQNKRADYLDAFWKVVNWEAVNTRFKIAAAA